MNILSRVFQLIALGCVVVTAAQGQLSTGNRGNRVPDSKENNGIRIERQSRDRHAQNNLLAVPSNDQCSGAEVIPAAGPFPYLAPVISDISEATTAGDPPIPDCQTFVSRSVWYSFTPADSGIYTFSTCTDRAPGTTVEDDVMAIYTSSGGCSGTFTRLQGACSDDGCGPGSLLAEVTAFLLKDTTYYVVIWQYGSTRPYPGKTALQLAVDREFPPANDTCAAALPLELNVPLHGTTKFAQNNYRLTGFVGFEGTGQRRSTALGRDVAYVFTAPTTDTYSIRVTGHTAVDNLVLYASSSCPSGPYPVLIQDVIGAANRSISSSAEEIFCLPLLGEQTIYIYVDSHRFGEGSDFVIEVNRCERESEPNNATASANTWDGEIEGSIIPNRDVDYYSNGTHPDGSRIFALVDGVAGSSPDFDLRITTSTDVLEYDDADNDSPFGATSANIAGAVLPADSVFLRVSQYSIGDVSEPYRLYALVQPPIDSATVETEPNDSLSVRTHASNNYFSGSLSGPPPSRDVDVYGFIARKGDLLFLSLDANPLRDNTPIDAALSLLDDQGNELMTVNDDGAGASNASDSSGLNAVIPYSPAEGLVYRAEQTGIYYAKVFIGTAKTDSTGFGDYLLSISKNGETYGGGMPADVAVTIAAPEFAATSWPMTTTITVTNSGPVAATNVRLEQDVPVGTTFLSLQQSQGSAVHPAIGDTGKVVCDLGSISPGQSATILLEVFVKAPVGDTIAQYADVVADQPDLYPLNNFSVDTTMIIHDVSDLALNKSSSKDSILAGDILEYTIRVVNNGPVDAANVEVADSLSALVTFESLSAPAGWTCVTPAVGETGAIRCTDTSFAMGDTAVFTYSVRVNSIIPNGAPVTNWAIVSSDYADPAPFNNAAAVTVTGVYYPPRIAIEEEYSLVKFGCRDSKSNRLYTKRFTVDNANAGVNVARMQWNAVSSDGNAAISVVTILNPVGVEGEDLQFLVNGEGLATGVHFRFITISAYDSVTNVPAENSPFTFTVRVEIEPVPATPVTVTRSVDTAGFTLFTNRYGHIIAAVKSNSGPLESFTVTLHPCQLPYGIRRMRYPARYYTFATTEPDPDVDVRLYYTINDLALMRVMDTDALRGWRQENPGGRWTPVSSFATSLHSSVTITGITDVSGTWAMAAPFIISPSPMPVLNLRAAWIGSGMAEISWTTSFKPAPFGFMVERRPAGGGAEDGWSTVGVVGVSPDGRYAFRDRADDRFGYQYRLITIDASGAAWESRPVSLSAYPVLRAENRRVPGKLRLEQNSPNPVVLSRGGMTRIDYGVPGRSEVILELFDSYGRLERTLVRQELGPGSYQASFDASGLSGGVYFYRLRAGSGIITRKMVVVR